MTQRWGLRFGGTPPARAAAALAAGLILVPGGAVRAEPAEILPGIALEGSLDVELNLDMLGRRGNRGAHAEAWTKTALGLALSLPGGFALNGVFKFEPTGVERGAADRVLDHAGWVDELHLSWTQGPLQLFAGKIHPRFGIARDRAPSLYGDEFAERYELSEKLGIGAVLTWSELAGFGEGWGAHDIRLEAFQADRSVVSEAALAPRFFLPDPATGGTRRLWRSRRALGGADNTQGVSNWAATAEGRGIALPFAALDYTLGYAARRAGLDSVEAGTAATERSTLAGFALEIPLPFEITATPLAEWVRMANADGVRNQRRDVMTAGLALARGPLGLAYTHGWERDTGPAPAQARQHSVVASYDLEDAAGWLKGFTWNLGWRRLRESGVAASDIGTQLVYGLRF
jgi:hypothetical protein